jgi:hypothetical protein
LFNSLASQLQRTTGTSIHRLNDYRVDGSSSTTINSPLPTSFSTSNLVEIASKDKLNESMAMTHAGSDISIGAIGQASSHSSPLLTTLNDTQKVFP